MAGRTAVSTAINEGSISGAIKASSSLHSDQTASVTRPATHPIDVKTHGEWKWMVTFPPDTHWTRFRIGLPSRIRSLFSGCPIRSLLNILKVLPWLRMGIEPKLPSPEPDQYTKLPRPLPDTEGHSSRTQIVTLLHKLLMLRTSAQKVTSSCWIPLSHPWTRRQTKRLSCCADQSETQGLPMRSLYLSLCRLKKDQASYVTAKGSDMAGQGHSGTSIFPS